jgi:hypothetical protein
MAILKINMKMTNPTDPQTFWENIYNFGKVIAPWGTVGWVSHQLINKVFKYFSDSRDAELRIIVKRETDLVDERWQRKFTELESKIDNLTRVILERQ